MTTALKVATSSDPRCSTTSQPDMSIYTDEIFGSGGCASFVSTTTKRRCVCRREHEYGNGVAIFTRDGDTARDFVSRGGRSAWSA